MNKAAIEISCCLCSNKTAFEVELAEGWANADDIYKDDALCPDHRVIELFIDSQCRGCVGGWGDCTLWKDFAHRDKRNLNDRDFELMRKGICPRRTNGTFSFNSYTGVLRDEDLSNVAPSEAGVALEKAIKDYWRRYE